MKLSHYFKRAILLLFMFSVPLIIQAQNQKVTIPQKQLTLRTAFEEIEKQTDLTIAYNESNVNVDQTISVDIKDKTVSQAMNDLLKGTNMTWQLQGKQIIITPASSTVPASQTAVQENKKTITGTVIDATGETVIGASIAEKGTTNGTVTDMDGNFSLKVSDNAVLQISYIGYTSQDIPVKNQSNLQITMKEDTQTLDEIVVVGYGTQKRSALTGAITTMDAKQIEQRPVTNVGSLLEGKMGLMVTSASGQPGGDDPKVSIRGFGSVTGNSTPLYVVDGFVFEGKLSDINSADIADMSILKDASSAAIYGNRAANGVILITTKKGNTDKPHISLTVNQGFDSRSMPEYDRLGADQWMQVSFDGWRNQYMTNAAYLFSLADANKMANGLYVKPDGTPVSDNFVESYIAYNTYGSPNAEGVWTRADKTQIFGADGKLQTQMLPGYRGDLDWLNAATRNGSRQEYIISGDGKASNNKSDYYFSVGYLDQQGYTKKSDFQRFSGRAKVNMTPTDWFRTGFNIAATDQQRNGPVGDYISTPFMWSRTMAPIYPVHTHDAETGAYLYDEYGNKIYDTGNAPGQGERPFAVKSNNIIWTNELDKSKLSRKTLTGNIFAEITFLKDFRAKISGSTDTQIAETNAYNNSSVGDSKGTGKATFTNHRYKTYTFLEQLTYDKFINDQYSLSVLAAHENYSWTHVYTNGSKTHEAVPGLTNLSTFSKTSTDLNGYSEDRTTESYLGRVQLNRDEKYYLDGSFRRDGSSRFYKDNRWGNFFSVGAAWNIKKEAFMDNIHQVNALKLRLNYGETGNDGNLSTYAWMALYDISAKMAQSVVDGKIVETVNNSFVLIQREAKDIRWEAQTSFGVALDGAVFDRVNFSLEYFDKRSRDLLFQVPLPLSQGALGAKSKLPLDWKNIGTVSNYGFELSLNVDLYRTKDFHWHADLNATALKNKILSLPPKEGGDNSIYPAYSRKSNGDIDSRTNQKYAEGHSIYEFYIYQYKGVDQMDGRALYKLDTDAWYIAEQPPADVTGKDLLAKKDDSGENNYVIINGVAYAYKAANAKREFSGSPIPKVMGSFSTGITYKGLALDVLFSYGLGGKVLDSPYEKLMSLGTAGTLHSLHPDLLKSWTGMPEGMTETSANRIDPNGIPGVNYQYNSYNNITSTRWLVNASYLMFKNINVSYALPKQWIQGLELSNVRLNATVENLHLFSARKGLNPQTDFDGEMGDVASMPRTISLGLKVDF